MKILVDRLTATPTPFHWEAGPEWWAAEIPAQPGMPLAVREPFVVDCLAHCMAEDVFLEGCVAGAVELECGRCLARYRHGLREPFRLILEPAGTRSPADPEAAEALRRDGVCLGDEIEAGWFRGDEINLNSFFREVVSLALPVKPLCDEECAGLCPQCGIELGKMKCDCRETKSNSPFAVLAALRDGSQSGEN
jgi:uncharacterized protein